MTAIGGRVAIVAAEDGVAVIKKEVIVDPESGVLMEVETTKVAVDVGGGNIAVREQKRIRGVVVQPRPSEPRRPAIAAPPPRRSSSRSSGSSCSIQ
jgi:hypothetical protein